MQDKDLKLLGRDHNSQHALRTLAEARRLCPGRVSVDVVFGRPGQTLDSWERELSELLRVCDDHVSLYQLTVERGTALFKQVANVWDLKGTFFITRCECDKPSQAVLKICVF